MIDGVHHACITVSDMEKSLAFYRDKLGMKEEMNLKFDADDVMMDLKGLEPKQHLVMLSAGNVNVELIQYLEPKGKEDPRRTCDFGTFHKPPEFIGESGGPLSGYGYVYFRGPDNEIVEFMQVPSA
jgi:catechol 2,3-dioxygenase-like lactoylglutathione lyase family enzyme